MRQRVMIALALACGPELIIGDEPTTALDVMTQGQILQLLEELRRDLGLALLLITHDLSVIAETCDRVAVMYAGQIAELGPVRDILASPQHPYTGRLLSGFSHVGGPRELGEAIPGSPPHPGEDVPRLPLRAALPPRLRRLRQGPARRCSSTHTAARPAASWPSSRERATPSTRPAGSHITYQRGRRPPVRAVDGVDLIWRRGETLGARGRVGLRQVDARARAARPRDAERRQHRRSTASPWIATCAPCGAGCS